jgi:hypothetical protein
MQGCGWVGGWVGLQDVWGQHTHERVHGSAEGKPGWGLVGLWPCVLTATDAEIIHASLCMYHTSHDHCAAACADGVDAELSNIGWVGRRLTIGGLSVSGN